MAATPKLADSGNAPGGVPQPRGLHDADGEQLRAGHGEPVVDCDFRRLARLDTLGMTEGEATTLASIVQAEARIAAVPLSSVRANLNRPVLRLVKVMDLMPATAFRPDPYVVAPIVSIA